MISERFANGFPWDFPMNFLWIRSWISRFPDEFPYDFLENLFKISLCISSAFDNEFPQDFLMNSLRISQWISLGFAHECLMNLSSINIWLCHLSHGLQKKHSQVFAWLKWMADECASCKQQGSPVMWNAIGVDDRFLWWPAVISRAGLLLLRVWGPRWAGPWQRTWFRWRSWRRKGWELP